MAGITIRNPDPRLRRKLRLRAARRGRSMEEEEEEARDILRVALAEREPPTDLVAAISRRFAPLGGVEPEPLPREPIREPPDLE